MRSTPVFQLKECQSQWQQGVIRKGLLQKSSYFAVQGACERGLQLCKGAVFCPARKGASKEGDREGNYPLFEIMLILKHSQQELTPDDASQIENGYLLGSEKAPHGICPQRHYCSQQCSILKDSDENGESIGTLTKQILG